MAKTRKNNHAPVSKRWKEEIEGLMEQLIGRCNLSFYQLMTALNERFLIPTVSFTPETAAEFSEQREILQQLLLIYRLYQEDKTHSSNPDVWGSYVEQRDLQFNSRLGQVLTPYNVSLMMASCLVGSEVIERQEPTTMCDPACGTGRMILAFMEAHRQQTIRDNFITYGIDIDLSMTTATLLNLIFSCGNGFVFHGDSLANRLYQGWAVMNMGRGISEWHLMTDVQLKTFERRFARTLQGHKGTQAVATGEKNTQIVLFSEEVRRGTVPPPPQMALL